MTPSKEVSEGLKAIEKKLLDWRPLTTLGQREWYCLRGMLNRWFNEIVELNVYMLQEEKKSRTS